MSIDRYPIIPRYFDYTFIAKTMNPVEVAKNLAYHQNEEYEALVVSISLKSVSIPNTYDLSRILVYRASPISYDRFGKIDSRNTLGTSCVIDALELVYGNKSPVGSKKWRTAFYFKEQPYPDGTRERPVMRILREQYENFHGVKWDGMGVDAASLKVLFEMMNVSLYILDSNEDIITKYVTTSPKSGIKAFCCIFASGHCYVINDNGAARHMNEKTHKILPSTHTIYNPEFTVAKNAWDHEEEEEEEFVYKSKKGTFDWAHAHHVKCDDMDTIDLWDLLNTSHTHPTLYIRQRHVK